MTKLTTGLAMVAALLTGALFAVPAQATSAAPPKQPGVLHVFDEAKLFTSEGIKTGASRICPR